MKINKVYFLTAELRLKGQLEKEKEQLIASGISRDAIDAICNGIIQLVEDKKKIVEGMLKFCDEIDKVGPLDKIKVLSLADDFVNFLDSEDKKILEKYPSVRREWKLFKEKVDIEYNEQETEDIDTKDNIKGMFLKLTFSMLQDMIVLMEGSAKEILDESSRYRNKEVVNMLFDLCQAWYCSSQLAYYTKEVNVGQEGAGRFQYSYYENTMEGLAALKAREDLIKNANGIIDDRKPFLGIVVDFKGKPMDLKGYIKEANGIDDIVFSTDSGVPRYFFGGWEVDGEFIPAKVMHRRFDDVIEPDVIEHRELFKDAKEITYVGNGFYYSFMRCHEFIKLLSAKSQLEDIAPQTQFLIACSDYVPASGDSLNLTYYRFNPEVKTSEVLLRIEALRREFEKWKDGTIKSLDAAANFEIVFKKAEELLGGAVIEDEELRGMVTSEAKRIDDEYRKKYNIKGEYTKEQIVDLNVPITENPMFIIEALFLRERLLRPKDGEGDCILFEEKDRIKHLKPHPIKRQVLKIDEQNMEVIGANIARTQRQIIGPDRTLFNTQAPGLVYVSCTNTDSQKPLSLQDVMTISGYPRIRIPIFIKEGQGFPFVSYLYFFKKIKELGDELGIKDIDKYLNEYSKPTGDISVILEKVVKDFGKESELLDLDRLFDKLIDKKLLPETKKDKVYKVIMDNYKFIIELYSFIDEVEGILSTKDTNRYDRAISILTSLEHRLSAEKDMKEALDKVVLLRSNIIKGKPIDKGLIPNLKSNIDTDAVILLLNNLSKITPLENVNEIMRQLMFAIEVNYDIAELIKLKDGLNSADSDKGYISVQLEQLSRRLIADWISLRLGRLFLDNSRQIESNYPLMDILVQGADGKYEKTFSQYMQEGFTYLNEGRECPLSFIMSSILPALGLAVLDAQGNFSFISNEAQFSAVDSSYEVSKLLPYLNEPSGIFSFYSSPRAHPEARRAEGSLEILRRFAPQDEGSENSPTPHLNKDNSFYWGVVSTVFPIPTFRHILGYLNDSEQFEVLSGGHKLDLWAVGCSNSGGPNDKINSIAYRPNPRYSYSELRKIVEDSMGLYSGLDEIGNRIVKRAYDGEDVLGKLVEIELPEAIAGFLKGINMPANRITDITNALKDMAVFYREKYEKETNLGKFNNDKVRAETEKTFIFYMLLQAADLLVQEALVEDRLIKTGILEKLDVKFPDIKIPEFNLGNALSVDKGKNRVLDLSESGSQPLLDNIRDGFSIKLHKGGLMFEGDTGELDWMIYLIYRGSQSLDGHMAVPLIVIKNTSCEYLYKKESDSCERALLEFPFIGFDTWISLPDISGIPSSEGRFWHLNMNGSIREIDKDECIKNRAMFVWEVLNSWWNEAGGQGIPPSLDSIKKISAQELDEDKRHSIGYKLVEYWNKTSPLSQSQQSLLPTPYELEKVDSIPRIESELIDKGVPYQTIDEAKKVMSLELELWLMHSKLEIAKWCVPQGREIDENFIHSPATEINGGLSIPPKEPRALARVGSIDITAIGGLGIKTQLEHLYELAKALDWTMELRKNIEELNGAIKEHNGRVVIEQPIFNRFQDNAYRGYELLLEFSKQLDIKYGARVSSLISSSFNNIVGLKYTADKKPNDSLESALLGIKFINWYRIFKLSDELKKNEETIEDADKPINELKISSEPKRLSEFEYDLDIEREVLYITDPQRDQLGFIVISGGIVNYFDLPIMEGGYYRETMPYRLKKVIEEQGCDYLIGVYSSITGVPAIEMVEKMQWIAKQLGLGPDKITWLTVMPEGKMPAISEKPEDILSTKIIAHLFKFNMGENITPLKRKVRERVSNYIERYQQTAVKEYLDEERNKVQSQMKEIYKNIDNVAPFLSNLLRNKQFITGLDVKRNTLKKISDDTVTFIKETGLLSGDELADLANKINHQRDSSIKKMNHLTNDLVSEFLVKDGYKGSKTQKEKEHNFWFLFIVSGSETKERKDYISKVYNYLLTRQDEVFNLYRRYLLILVKELAVKRILKDEGNILNEVGFEDVFPEGMSGSLGLASLSGTARELTKGIRKHDITQKEVIRNSILDEQGLSESAPPKTVKINKEDLDSIIKALIRADELKLPPGLYVSASENRLFIAKGRVGLSDPAKPILGFENLLGLNINPFEGILPECPWAWYRIIKAEDKEPPELARLAGEISEDFGIDPENVNKTPIDMQKIRENIIKINSGYKSICNLEKLSSDIKTAKSELKELIPAEDWDAVFDSMKERSFIEQKMVYLVYTFLRKAQVSVYRRAKYINEAVNAYENLPVFNVLSEDNEDLQLDEGSGSFIPDPSSRAERGISRDPSALRPQDDPLVFGKNSPRGQLDEASVEQLEQVNNGEFLRLSEEPYFQAFLSLVRFKKKASGYLGRQTTFKDIEELCKDVDNLISAISKHISPDSARILRSFPGWLLKNQPKLTQDVIELIINDVFYSLAFSYERGTIAEDADRLNEALVNLGASNSVAGAMDNLKRAFSSKGISRLEDMPSLLTVVINMIEEGAKEEIFKTIKEKTKDMPQEELIEAYLKLNWFSRAIGSLYLLEYGFEQISDAIDGNWKGIKDPKLFIEALENIWGGITALDKRMKEREITKSISAQYYNVNDPDSPIHNLRISSRNGKAGSSQLINEALNGYPLNYRIPYFKGVGVIVIDPDGQGRFYDLPRIQENSMAWYDTMPLLSLLKDNKDSSVIVMEQSFNQYPDIDIFDALSLFEVIKDLTTGLERRVNAVMVISSPSGKAYRSYRFSPGYKPADILKAIFQKCSKRELYNLRADSEANKAIVRMSLEAAMDKQKLGFSNILEVYLNNIERILADVLGDEELAKKVVREDCKNNIENIAHTVRNPTDVVGKSGGLDDDSNNAMAVISMIIFNRVKQALALELVREGYLEISDNARLKSDYGDIKTFPDSPLSMSINFTQFVKENLERFVELNDSQKDIIDGILKNNFSSGEILGAFGSLYRDIFILIFPMLANAILDNNTYEIKQIVNLLTRKDEHGNYILNGLIGHYFTWGAECYYPSWRSGVNAILSPTLSLREAMLKAENAFRPRAGDLINASSREDIDAVWGILSEPLKNKVLDRIRKEQDGWDGADESNEGLIERLCAYHRDALMFIIRDIYILSKSKDKLVKIIEDNKDKKDPLEEIYKASEEAEKKGELKANDLKVYLINTSRGFASSKVRDKDLKPNKSLQEIIKTSKPYQKQNGFFDKLLSEIGSLETGIDEVLKEVENRFPYTDDMEPKRKLIDSLGEKVMKLNQELNRQLGEENDHDKREVIKLSFEEMAHNELFAEASEPELSQINTDVQGEIFRQKEEDLIETNRHEEFRLDILKVQEEESRRIVAEKTAEEANRAVSYFEHVAQVTHRHDFSTVYEARDNAAKLIEGLGSFPTPHPEERSDEGSLKILQLKKELEDRIILIENSFKNRAEIVFDSAIELSYNPRHWQEVFQRRVFWKELNEVVAWAKRDNWSYGEVYRFLDKYCLPLDNYDPATRLNAETIREASAKEDWRGFLDEAINNAREDTRVRIQREKEIEMALSEIDRQKRLCLAKREPWAAHRDSKKRYVDDIAYWKERYEGLISEGEIDRKVKLILGWAGGYGWDYSHTDTFFRYYGTLIPFETLNEIETQKAFTEGGIKWDNLQGYMIDKVRGDWRGFWNAKYERPVAGNNYSRLSADVRGVLLDWASGKVGEGSLQPEQDINISPQCWWNIAIMCRIFDRWVSIQVDLNEQLPWELFRDMDKEAKINSWNNKELQKNILDEIECYKNACEAKKRFEAKAGKLRRVTDLEALKDEVYVVINLLRSKTQKDKWIKEKIKEDEKDGELVKIYKNAIYEVAGREEQDELRFDAEHWFKAFNGEVPMEFIEGTLEICKTDNLSSYPEVELFLYRKLAEECGLKRDFKEAINYYVKIENNFGDEIDIGSFKGDISKAVISQFDLAVSDGVVFVSNGERRTFTAEEAKSLIRQYGLNVDINDNGREKSGLELSVELEKAFGVGEARRIKSSLDEIIELVSRLEKRQLRREVCDIARLQAIQECLSYQMVEGAEDLLSNLEEITPEGIKAKIRQDIGALKEALQSRKAEWAMIELQARKEKEIFGKIIELKNALSGAETISEIEALDTQRKELLQDFSVSDIMRLSKSFMMGKNRSLARVERYNKRLEVMREEQNIKLRQEALEFARKAVIEARFEEAVVNFLIGMGEKKDNTRFEAENAIRKLFENGNGIIEQLYQSRDSLIQKLNAVENDSPDNKNHLIAYTHFTAGNRLSAFKCYEEAISAYGQALELMPEEDKAYRDGIESSRKAAESGLGKLKETEDKIQKEKTAFQLSKKKSELEENRILDAKVLTSKAIGEIKNTSSAYELTKLASIQEAMESISLVGDITVRNNMYQELCNAIDAKVKENQKPELIQIPEKAEAYWRNVKLEENRILEAELLASKAIKEIERNEKFDAAQKGIAALKDRFGKLNDYTERQQYDSLVKNIGDTFSAHDIIDLAEQLIILSSTEVDSTSKKANQRLNESAGTKLSELSEGLSSAKSSDELDTLEKKANETILAIRADFIKDNQDKEATKKLQNKETEKFSNILKAARTKLSQQQKPKEDKVPKEPKIGSDVAVIKPIPENKLKKTKQTASDGKLDEDNLRGLLDSNKDSAIKENSLKILIIKVLIDFGVTRLNAGKIGNAIFEWQQDTTREEKWNMDTFLSICGFASMQPNKVNDLVMRLGAGKKVSDIMEFINGQEKGISGWDEAIKSIVDSGTERAVATAMLNNCIKVLSELSYGIKIDMVMTLNNEEFIYKAKDKNISLKDNQNIFLMGKILVLNTGVKYQNSDIGIQINLLVYQVSRFEILAIDEANKEAFEKKLSNWEKIVSYYGVALSEFKIEGTAPIEGQNVFLEGDKLVVNIFSGELDEYEQSIYLIYQLSLNKEDKVLKEQKELIDELKIHQLKILFLEIAKNISSGVIPMRIEKRSEPEVDEPVILEWEGSKEDKNLILIINETSPARDDFIKTKGSIGAVIKAIKDKEEPIKARKIPELVEEQPIEALTSI